MKVRAMALLLTSTLLSAVNACSPRHLPLDEQEAALNASSYLREYAFKEGINVRDFDTPKMERTQDGWYVRFDLATDRTNNVSFFVSDYGSTEYVSVLD